MAKHPSMGTQGRTPVRVTRRLHAAALIFYLGLGYSLHAQSAGLGRIVFPVSGPPEAQKRFTRGVLFLHSFEYLDAREEFIAARTLAPNFAMAYWGEAMTYNEPAWFAQEPASARTALSRLGATSAQRRSKAPTEREKAYLNAVEILYGQGTKEERDLAYAAAMRSIHQTYPKDLEAAAFYALALIGTCHHGRDFRTYMQAAAIAEDIFAANPEHPGAIHYLIHCYDDPIHAPLGLRAARLYAAIAPQAAHARHMPAHIFFALGMWQEGAAANEDAWNVSRANAARKGLPIEAGGYHALWWLEYAYLQQGRYADAYRVLQTIGQIAVAPLPPLLRFHLVHMRVMYSIETGKPYQAGVDTSGLDMSASGADLFASGMTALNSGLRDQAERSLASLQPSTAPQSDHHRHLYPGDVQALQIMQKELAALLHMADGKSGEAIELMKAAVALEDKAVFESGPPLPPKPAHELLGEILLQLGQSNLARVQFEISLTRSPKRALSLLGLARSFAQGGNKAAARQIYDELRKMWSAADPAILKALDDSLR